MRTFKTEYREWSKGGIMAVINAKARIRQYQKRTGEVITVINPFYS